MNGKYSRSKSLRFPPQAFECRVFFFYCNWLGATRRSSIPMNPTKAIFDCFVIISNNLLCRRTVERLLQALGGSLKCLNSQTQLKRGALEILS